MESLENGLVAIQMPIVSLNMDQTWVDVVGLSKKIFHTSKKGNKEIHKKTGPMKRGPLGAVQLPNVQPAQHVTLQLHPAPLVHQDKVHQMELQSTACLQICVTPQSMKAKSSMVQLDACQMTPALLYMTEPERLLHLLLHLEHLSTRLCESMKFKYELN